MAILSLGLRLGEALALSREDIDFEARRIQVRATLQKHNREFTRVAPKSQRSHRLIDLPAVTITALTAHADLQRQALEWEGVGWKGNPWKLVFTSSIGTPVDERNALRILQDKILPRAGLPKMRIHDLRHRAAAILIAQGVAAKAISEILGHTSVSFTMSTYGHLLNEVRRDIADKMDAALTAEIPAPSGLAPSLAPLAVREQVN